MPNIVIVTHSQDAQEYYFDPQYVRASPKQFMVDNKIESVIWHHKPTYLLHKRACSNAGHCLMENLFPLFMLLMTWEVQHLGTDSYPNTCTLINTYKHMYT
jgi:hypothetical protein